MDDEIPLFSIIFKSSSNQDLKEDGSTSTQITGNPEENVLFEDLNYKASEDELELEDHFTSDESSSLQNLTEVSDLENRASSNKLNLPQNPKHVKENYMPSDIFDVENGKEYDTEDVSSDELSFDDDLLDSSHLISTTEGFEVYSVPMTTVYEALEKNKKCSEVSSAHTFIYGSVDEYRKKLKEVKLKGVRYRRKIRNLEKDCSDLKAKVKNMQQLIKTAQCQKKPKLSFMNTLDFFEMDSDDSS